MDESTNAEGFGYTFYQASNIGDGPCDPPAMPGFFRKVHCMDLSDEEAEELWRDKGEFECLAVKYRRRFEQDDIALTYREAVEAYRLVVPEIRLVSDPERAARLYNRMMIVWFPDGDVAFDLCAIETLLLEHTDEACFQRKKPWDRYLTHEALAYFVEYMDHAGVTATKLGPAWGKLLSRCRDALSRRLVSRPRGPDPRIGELRDPTVTSYLQRLEGNGLLVTSRDGENLAGAMAKATDFGEDTIAKIWENAGTGVGPAPPYREGKLSRERAVTCAGCGARVAKIDAGFDFEAGRGEARCESCRGLRR